MGDTPPLSIDGTWLVENVNRHTLAELPGFDELGKYLTSIDAAALASSVADEDQLTHCTNCGHAVHPDQPHSVGTCPTLDGNGPAW